MRKFKAMLLWFTLFLPTAGQAFEPDSLLIKNAMAEGKVVWYSSAPVYANSRIKYEFEDRYPFIKVEIGRWASSQIEGAYELEIKDKDIKVDVLHLSMPPTILKWKQQGYLMHYETPTYAAFPDGFKDEGWWAAARNLTVCIGYNSEAIQSTKAPKTWLDLIDENKNEAWRGKMLMGNIRKGGTRLAQYYVLRELYGTSFWQKIADITAEVEEEKSQDLATFFDNKERPLSVTYLGYYYDDNAIKKGQPVRAVWPTDGVPMVQSPLAIAKDAPHPNAAKLLFEFILSQEGQALFQVLAGDYSVRDDVPPMPGKRPFKELNIIQIDWEKVEQKREECTIEFETLFKKPLDALLLKESADK